MAELKEVHKTWAFDAEHALKYLPSEPWSGPNTPFDECVHLLFRRATTYPE